MRTKLYSSLAMLLALTAALVVPQRSFGQSITLSTPIHYISVFDPTLPMVAIQPSSTQTGDIIQGLDAGGLPGYRVTAAGNVVFSGTYQNFGTVEGFAGYGFRNNVGHPQFKNSGGAWADFGTGAGTVTSVGLSLPAEITVTGSPIIGAGTLTGAWASALANRVFAAPNGANGTPGFRGMVGPDMPSLWNNIAFADHYAGADAGLKIAAAYAALPATGGVIDARGLSGSQAITTSLVVTKPIHFIFGTSPLATPISVSVANAIDIQTNGVSVQGSGIDNTVFRYTLAAGNFIQTPGALGVTYTGIHIYDFTVMTNGAPNAQTAILMQTTQRAVIENVFIHYMANGIRFTGDGTSVYAIDNTIKSTVISAYTGIGISLDHTIEFNIYDTDIWGYSDVTTGTGLLLDTGAIGSFKMHMGHIAGGKNDLVVQNTNLGGAWGGVPANFNFNGTYFDTAGGDDVLISAGSGGTFTDAWYAGAGQNTIPVPTAIGFHVTGGINIQVKGGFAFLNEAQGLKFEGSGVDYKISGIQVFDNNVSGTALLPGIEVTGTVDYVSVQDVRSANKGGGGQQFGLTVATTGTHITVAGNEFAGNATAETSGVSTLTTFKTPGTAIIGGKLGIATTTPGSSVGAYTGFIAGDISWPTMALMRLATSGAGGTLTTAWWFHPFDLGAGGWFLGTNGAGQYRLAYGNGADEAAAITDAKDGTNGMTCTQPGNVCTFSTPPERRGIADLTGQTTSLGPTTIYAVPVGGAGQYLICINAGVTTTEAVPTLDGSITFTQSAIARTISMFDTISFFTTDGFGGSCQLAYADASTNIQYTTTVTGAIGAGQYDLHVSVMKH